MGAVPAVKRSPTVRLAAIGATVLLAVGVKTLNCRQVSS
jgi:hypothetical protein